ncbi:MAG TPA: helix-turn-helix domain-containing protein [Petrimonas sp.]|uniref:helix-turn-helix domain-containing protein n=1 Tax=Petrimonas sp. TaxID=2023866 RepID=UPI00095E5FF0|nr:MAG: DNA-binding protein [Bacteroidia bacterium 43-41]HHV85651.1 helix-turn-helix domain-containing protein [Petrimonas sp.]
MEIVNIEGRTYEEMMRRFKEFTQRVDNLCKEKGNKEIGQWLDSQDICLILDISKRKLQTLRDSRQIAFTMVGHKVFYKAGDVQKVITKMSEKKEVENE